MPLCNSSIAACLVTRCLAALCLAVSQSAIACPEYSVQVVSLPYCGLPGYGLGPQAANESGNIVGAYGLCSEQTGAFLWDGNPPVNLLNLGLGVTSAIGNDINSKLQIVGTKEGPTGHIGFLHHNGKTIELNSLPGSSFSEAYAINESGVVVGMFAGNQAFVWEDGVMTHLKPSIGPSAEAHDINDHGQIVGWMGVAPFPPFEGEAFLWHEGKTVPLGYPASGVASEAWAISDNGQICGVFALSNPKAGPVIRQAFHWHNGVMTELGVLPGYVQSFAQDVNNDGTVVGYCATAFGGGPAFVWHNGIITDLNSFVLPELNLDLKEAVSISNNGQILCAARDENNAAVAVLLSPIPSPIGDSDCDSDIDVDDLLGVINNWAHESPKGSNALPPCDFDHDGTVELDDLMIVIDNWSSE